jgi:hypothetical protein
MEFNGDHVDGGRADIADNMDEVTANCKSHAVGDILFGAVVYTDTGIGGVTAAIGRDLFALDELQQTGKFLGVRFTPEFFVLGVDEELLHFHELAGGFVKDGLKHVSGELPACRAAWCDDVVCDVAVCVDAGQYCLLCDGGYLCFAVSVARWAIFGCGCGFKDANIGCLLRLTKLFRQSGGRFIEQDGLVFFFVACNCRKKSFWLGRWWAGGKRGGHPWRVHCGLHPWRWRLHRSWGRTLGEVVGVFWGCVRTVSGVITWVAGSLLYCSGDRSVSFFMEQIYKDCGFEGFG